MFRLLSSSLTLLFFSVSSYAAVANSGTVSNMSGTLSVKKLDGSVKILSQKSAVEAGDLLTTEKDSYAQINFPDGSQATLRPKSQMKLEAFNFKADKPQEDNALFRLLKGGMRTVTGLVGKRGNLDAYKIQTATATIGIRGSSGDTLSFDKGKEDCVDVIKNCEKAEKGVYHTTYTGSYIMTNEAGSIIIEEGQAAWARDRLTRPVHVDLGAMGEELKVMAGFLQMQLFQDAVRAGEKLQCQI